MAPVQLGKWLVLFCDEINLPDMDNYGMVFVFDLGVVFNYICWLPLSFSDRTRGNKERGMIVT